MDIKVLGPGCVNCISLEQHVQEAVAQLKMDASIEKITDYGVMMKYGMMGSPGLVINNKLVSSGKVLSTKQVIEMIRKSQ